MPSILPFLLCLQPALSATQVRQWHRIILALLSMSGRVTQLGIARWAGKGSRYRTVHRFFQTRLDWLRLKGLFFEKWLYDPADTYLLVGDETVCQKAGKHTYGLDRFFSSLADKPVSGVAFFTFGLVRVGKREAYPLCAEQVVRTEEEKAAAQQRRQARRKSRDPKAPPKKAGRPRGQKNRSQARVTLSPELSRIQTWGRQVMQAVGTKVGVRYFVLDGHFGNRPAYQMVQELGLHLISRLRRDAALYREPTSAQKQRRPNLKYGDKLDYQALPTGCCVSSVQEGAYRLDLYQMRCRHKDFRNLLNVVVLVKTHLKSGRSGHVVLFSSDLDLAAETLVDYYRLRFQIEFVFREAKQHWGLSDFMGVKQTSVANAVGLSLWMVLLGRVLLTRMRETYPQAGVWDLKSYYRGRRYAWETLKSLPDLAEGIVWEQVQEQVARLGWIHTPAARGVGERLSGTTKHVSEAGRSVCGAA